MNKKTGKFSGTILLSIVNLLIWGLMLNLTSKTMAKQNSLTDKQNSNLVTQNQTQSNLNSQENLQPIPLDSQQAENFLDLRGVGDSGMALTYKQPLSLNQTLSDGLVANFGQRLDYLDPTGKSYRGDLSFLNWETALGTSCATFRGKPSPTSYAFVSHPDNLREAYLRGFNLISLANNHSWDCPKGENGLNGALVSSSHLQNLTQNIPANWLWHGVGQEQYKSRAVVQTMTIKGKTIKIAFASLYVGGACTYITCVSDQNAILRSLRDANADLRILSLHSWNDATQQQLVKIGRDFIRNYNGDVVFGHGPHEWKPVTIVQSTSGKKGVMFESLGNFIHPNLAPRGKDLIGRVLLDLETLQLRQVQAIPVKLNGAVATFNNATNPLTIPTNNLTWVKINDSQWSSGINAQIQGVYANIK